MKVLFLTAKETDLGKLTTPFYEFVPHKTEPFEPAIYQDLQVLEMAGVVIKQTKYHMGNTKLTGGFKLNNIATLYTLTNEGMEYAKALVSWLDKKDPEITLKLRTYKTYYAQVPLKKLLDYIYRKYPEYTRELVLIKKIIK